MFRGSEDLVGPLVSPPVGGGQGLAATHPFESAVSVGARDFDGFYCPSTRAPLDTPILKPPEEGGDEPLPAGRRTPFTVLFLSTPPSIHPIDQPPITILNHPPPHLVFYPIAEDPVPVPVVVAEVAVEAVAGEEGEGGEKAEGEEGEGEEKGEGEEGEAEAEPEAEEGGEGGEGEGEEGEPVKAPKPKVLKPPPPFDTPDLSQASLPWFDKTELMRPEEIPPFRIDR